MDINKNLIEYSKLNLQLKEINESIYEIFDFYKENLVEVQLFKYFKYNKENWTNLTLEQWGKEENQIIDKLSYELLELFKQKRNIKQRINYRKRNIINYGIELAMGVK